jgi:hypothetical protein
MITDASRGPQSRQPPGRGTGRQNATERMDLPFQRALRKRAGLLATG